MPIIGMTLTLKYVKYFLPKQIIVHVIVKIKVTSSGIEPESKVSETSILSVVLRGQNRVAKIQKA
jgi:hypothetical protein